MDRPQTLYPDPWLPRLPVIKHYDLAIERAWYAVEIEVRLYNCAGRIAVDFYEQDKSGFAIFQSAINAAFEELPVETFEIDSVPRKYVRLTTQSGEEEVHHDDENRGVVWLGEMVVAISIIACLRSDKFDRVDYVEKEPSARRARPSRKTLMFLVEAEANVLDINVDDIEDLSSQRLIARAIDNKFLKKTGSGKVRLTIAALKAVFNAKKRHVYSYYAWGQYACRIVSEENSEQFAQAFVAGSGLRRVRVAEVLENGQPLSFDEFRDMILEKATAYNSRVSMKTGHLEPTYLDAKSMASLVHPFNTNSTSKEPNDKYFVQGILPKVTSETIEWSRATSLHQQSISKRFTIFGHVGRIVRDLDQRLIYQLFAPCRFNSYGLFNWEYFLSNIRECDQGTYFREIDKSVEYYKERGNFGRDLSIVYEPVMHYST